MKLHDQMPSFRTFFEALNGRAPFPWQERLAAQLAQDEWPDVLDLPTGSGKTAVIDCWVCAAAVTSKAPTRLAFVVDRRQVVDEAHERASRIATTLRTALNGGGSTELEIIAKALMRRASGDGQMTSLGPLVASLMRGGIVPDTDWALFPRQPAVIVSTVDQIGSRLMFRGYGLSEKAAPIHAGLLAWDTALVLDEAHLSTVFRKTLEQIRGTIDRFARPMVEPIRIVEATATPAVPGNRRFSLGEEDRSHPVLRKRLEAHKLVRMDDRRGGKVKLGMRLTQLAGQEMHQLRVLRQGKAAPVIAVVVNTVKTAREVWASLSRQYTEAGDVDVILLIGRSRGVDRARLMERYRDRLRADRPDDAAGGRDRPLIVVATQCIEAGPDFSFNCLITEMAPLSSLFQRFGRQDRLGTFTSTNDSGEREGTISWVVENLRNNEGVNNKTDPVYGMRLDLLFDAMVACCEEDPVAPTFLASPSEVGRFKDRVLELAGDAGREAQPYAPLLSSAIIRRLYVSGQRDVEISPWLHGVDGAAEVSVSWRWEVGLVKPGEPIPEGLLSFLVTVPVTSAETITIPVAVARTWLEKGLTDTDIADIDVETEGPDPKSANSPHVLKRAGEGWVWASPYDVKPGDIFVAAPNYGGTDEYGWGNSQSVSDDVLNAAADMGRGRKVIRLFPGTPDGIPDHLVEAVLGRSVVHDPDATVSFDEAECLDAAKDLLEGILEELGPGELRAVPFDPVRPMAGAFLIHQRAKSRAAQRVGSFVDDEDLQSLASAGQVELGGHGKGVGQLARKYGHEDEADLLDISGQGHDVGKSDPRNQAYLNGGIPAAPGAVMLAKSRYAPGEATEKLVRRLSSFPKGLRHEALSVSILREGIRQMSISLPEDVNVDLFLYLVGTHHGHGRPFFPPVTDPGNRAFVCPSEAAPEIIKHEISVPEHGHSLHHLDSGWLELVARLLDDRSPWHLARLEALLRLADHRRSEEEEGVMKGQRNASREMTHV